MNDPAGMSQIIPRLRFLDTTLYAIVATIGIRWIPVAAALGPASLPLWVLAFFVFYVPLAIATAELTSRFRGGGSLYSWVRDTFGPLSGFVCGWFYWVSLLPYFAGIIYFLSGLVLSAIGADAHNSALYLTLSLALVGIATAVQFLGLRIGKWLTNMGAGGSWLVFLLIIAAGATLVWRGGSATDFLASSWKPPFGFDTAILWGTIVFALSGTESVAFLRNEIRGGIPTIVRVLAALGIAMVLIYMIGTAAMLVILPEAQLTRLSGLPDALHAGFALFHQRRLQALRHRRRIIAGNRLFRSFATGRTDGVVWHRRALACRSRSRQFPAAPVCAAQSQDRRAGARHPASGRSHGCNGDPEPGG
jgi:amino acid transporter